jgi:hypothetical protein
MLTGGRRRLATASGGAHEGEAEGEGLGTGGRRDLKALASGVRGPGLGVRVFGVTAAGRRIWG